MPSKIYPSPSSSTVTTTHLSHHRTTIRRFPIPEVPAFNRSQRTIPSSKWTHSEHPRESRSTIIEDPAFLPMETIAPKFLVLLVVLLLIYTLKSDTEVLGCRLALI